MTYEVYKQNNTFILRNFKNTISLGNIWAFGSNEKKKKKTKENAKPKHLLKLILDDELYNKCVLKYWLSILSILAFNGFQVWEASAFALFSKLLILQDMFLVVLYNFFSCSKRIWMPSYMRPKVVTDLKNTLCYPLSVI